MEATFLIHRVRPWTANLSKRLVKSPKLLIEDTGLMSYLLNLSEARVLEDPNLAGHILETFVGTEILKQTEWSDSRPYLLHYRTSAGAEVDFVLEAGTRRVAGIEVKLTQSLKESDFRGLQALAEDAGSSFVGGVVFHTGSACLPFGKKIWGIPIACLWDHHDNQLLGSKN